MNNKTLKNYSGRERFGSRLGFILISAGCAIGLGNVYRFPITTGAYGGGLFVVLYLAFLILLGIPVMTTELANGRASQRSIVSSFNVLEKPGQKWGFMRYIGLAGNYLLMMFYIVITGWMLIYCFRFLSGNMYIESTDASYVASQFSDGFDKVATNGWLNVLVAFIVILVGFGVCSFGLRNGVERITKYMMIILFLLLIGIAIYSLTLSGAKEGIKFYLVPNAQRLKENKFITILTSAMGQAFFTLSIGIGTIAIFGSYIGKDRRLFGEAITITALDTFVALMAGLIIFPACFTFNGGKTADAGSVGSSFLFTTLSATFNSMGPIAGRIIGTLFFLFMIFAAMSTVIAVFENIVSFWMELTGMSRKKICLINMALLCVLVLPAILGNSVLSFISLNISGSTKRIMDFEDYAVSNLLLPIGSLFYVLFSFNKFGWGSENFYKEVNTGKGLKFPKFMKGYMQFVLPVIIVAVLVLSFLNIFGIV